MDEHDPQIELADQPSHPDPQEEETPIQPAEENEASDSDGDDRSVASAVQVHRRILGPSTASDAGSVQSLARSAHSERQQAQARRLREVETDGPNAHGRRAVPLAETDSQLAGLQFWYAKRVWSKYIRRVLPFQAPIRDVESHELAYMSSHNPFGDSHPTGY
jgi:hypothetical protein